MHNLDKNFDNLSLQCANIIKMLNKLSLDYNEKSIKFERIFKKILKRLNKEKNNNRQIENCVYVQVPF